MDARETAFSIHHTALFEGFLEDLLKKNGTAEAAANKTVYFINAVNGK
jgi:hypothetical protein